MKTHTTASVASLLIAVVLIPTAIEAQAPLEDIRNYTWVSDELASAGQIGYDQIPLLAEEGYDVVVNLAIADEERNGREGFLVTQEGLTYIHIPVDWQAPSMEHVELFFDVMQANEGRKVFVHCFANMRATAFVYLYRTLVLGESDADALATMHEVWDPDEVEQWRDLIERAQAAHGS
ncbi:MAG: protein tyrosine phosphatase family protein [Gemmatimonadota bacterium]